MTVAATAAGLLALPLVVLGAGSAGAEELAPLTTAGAAGVDGQYIVVLEDDLSPRSVTAAEIGIKAGDVTYTYDDALNGYAAELTPAELTAVRSSSEVAFVEQVAEVHALDTQQNATWGIDRIDQTNLPLSRTYTYDYTGAGVSAYIIDTGIVPNHPDFGGRAQVAYDAYGGNGIDGNGHGTHVAGTIGSTTYGVAKEVELYGVKVLSNSGSGTTAGVIAGVDWVAGNAPANSVANLSLGGPASTALDNAVNALSASGVFVAVAAGNETQNASNVSPARASGVTTVAASTSTDASASYTNYGSAVDIYAPGSAITSTWITGTRSISGTSMASPHVAGAAALYKDAVGDNSQSTIQNWLRSNASSGVLSGVRSGTPNLLLNVSAL
ncbi:peptidase S8 [Marinitenerispora sediminis]|uniref:Peptidase S8 n=2 Tax=Marinitenerispora sediminis TaxID=1931232 RepID=A0A368T0K9_9ACTN|nr:S8 family peptidase [Marinitenerispora sediminis]RCV48962.1 peptidase S8 [Marinitenerispora sediminis]RCV52945.1 peptidase S8 [Marinitenerispora sediminis]RCV53733.1 peptidase S8 [Marinitenerispora sediminis]